MLTRDTFDPVDLTKRLIQIDTSTGRITPDKAAAVAEMLRALGFEVTTLELNGLTHLRADVGPANAKLSVAFVGHYDVVPVADGWTHDPFSAHEKEGIVYGRGASDMKSGDAAMLGAALDLAQEGVRSAIFLPADEETSSKGMPALLGQRQEHFDFCICGEPTSKVTLGDCLKVGRRGVMQGSIVLKGQSGHAAYSERTHNVVLDIPAVLKAVSETWDDECYGTRTTVSVTNVATDSLAVNVIPSRVTLTFDARFSPARRSDDVLAELDARLNQAQVPYEVVVTKRTEPYLTDGRADPDSPQSKLISTAVSCIERICGLTPRLTCDGGASDARFVAWKGIPTIEFGVPHGNMHGVDEFVSVQAIRKLRDVYREIIASLAR